MWPQSRYRGRPRVYLQAMRSPTSLHARVQPKEILITSAKRLLQQNLQRADSRTAARKARPAGRRPDWQGELEQRPALAGRRCSKLTAVALDNHATSDRMSRKTKAAFVADVSQRRPPVRVRTQRIQAIARRREIANMLREARARVKEVN
jgi:hypothetical protein